jgi:hypothetical protein
MYIQALLYQLSTLYIQKDMMDGEWIIKNYFDHEKGAKYDIPCKMGKRAAKINKKYAEFIYKYYK